MSASRNIPDGAPLAALFAPILGKLDGLRRGLRLGLGNEALSATIVGEVIDEINAILRAASEPEAKACTCTVTRHERCENAACPVHFPVRP